MAPLQNTPYKGVDAALMNFQPLLHAPYRGGNAVPQLGPARNSRGGPAHRFSDPATAAPVGFWTTARGTTKCATRTTTHGVICQWDAPGPLSATNAVAPASWRPEGVADSGPSPGTSSSSGGSYGNGRDQGVGGSDDVRKGFGCRDSKVQVIARGTRCLLGELPRSACRRALVVVGGMSGRGRLNCTGDTGAPRA